MLGKTAENGKATEKSIKSVNVEEGNEKLKNAHIEYKNKEQYDLTEVGDEILLVPAPISDKIYYAYVEL